MKGYKHMNEKKFKQIKDLQKVEGMTRKMIIMITHVSYPTVMKVEEAKDFPAYKAMFYKPRVKEITQGTPEAPLTQLDRIEGMLELLLKDRKERGWLEKAMGVRT